MVPGLLEKGEIYVRGQLFNFCLHVINKYFDFGLEDDMSNDDLDILAGELSGKATSK